MYIKDLQPGIVRPYGTNSHDSLVISDDGRTLSYYNLQNGDGSRYGDYVFCDDEGKIPKEIDVYIERGADIYFNIGGFDNAVIAEDINSIYPDIFVKHKIGGNNQ